MYNLGEPIAVGRTAEIYSYGEGKVLKLFLSATPQSWIDKEIEIGRYIQATELPVPKVYERVNNNDREGVIYERIEGCPGRKAHPFYTGAQFPHFMVEWQSQS